MIILGVRNFRVFEILEHLPYIRLYVHTVSKRTLKVFELGSYAADYFSSNLPFSKVLLKNIVRMSNILDPDQARHFLCPCHQQSAVMKFFGLIQER